MYQSHKFTDEELKLAMSEGVAKYEFARIHDVHVSNVRRRWHKIVRQGYSPEHDMTHQAPDGYILKGTSTLYNEEGKLKAQWVKTTIDEQRQAELMKAAIEAMTEDLPKLKPNLQLPEYANKDLLAVYPLGDPHIGMLSYKPETGEKWSLKIAEKVFCTAFDRAIKSAPSCDQAIIFNLGDFFHYDNIAGVTSRSGNSLDTDSTYAHMVKVGVKIIRQMITTALTHHNKVKIINSIGNHDDTGAIFLSVCLTHMYEDEPRVEVEQDPSPFHYVRFGKVLLGAHHGHTCKMDNLPGVMATDKYKDWGETRYRYWLTGHIHHDSKKEYPGCMVESFRTLAAKDAYATYGGWRSGRDTKVIVYHKNYGEVERHTINIEQV